MTKEKGKKEPKKTGKQFSSEYQPEEKWTEEKALELGNELIEWLSVKDNYFYEEFLVIVKDHYPGLASYLAEKFPSFSKLLKKALKMQELNLIKAGITKGEVEQATLIFVLKNHHNYKDKKDFTSDGDKINLNPVQFVKGK